MPHTIQTPPRETPLELVTIPCLEDNYAFLLHNPDTGETLLVDVPAAAPVIGVLDAHGWSLTDILLTHHHADHVGGLADLQKSIGTAARVIGAQADAYRLPPLDLEITEGDLVTICGEDTAVFDVSGHTIGHIAVHFPKTGVLFTGDSLMALGCGRLFEGTPAQMWQSMLKLRALPDETLVCSGHEYTQTNAAFAQTIEPGNDDLILRTEQITQDRAQGHPTVPSKLGLEKRTNPFLRADDPALQTALGRTTTDPAPVTTPDPVDVFTTIRKKRDVF